MSERLGYLASIETLRACFAEACVKRAMAELRAEQAESRLAEIEAAPPVVEVDDAMCDRAYIRKWENQPSLSGVEPDDEDRQWALEWLTAWRAELGPQLGLVTREEMARADARIAELETAIKRQAAAVKMLDMSQVARAETMMQHAQVLHDQSNTTALESERAANALLTERIAQLEQSVTIRDTEIARLETDLELARRDVVRLKTKVNATFDAVKEHAPRTVTRRIFASMHELIDNARAGNGG